MKRTPEEIRHGVFDNCRGNWPTKVFQPLPEEERGALDALKEQPAPSGAVAGIDPRTKRAEIVGFDNDDTWAEIRKHGFIAVPITVDRAQKLWRQIIPDIYYVLTAPNADSTP
jgi:hypothetical protein